MLAFKLTSSKAIVRVALVTYSVVIGFCFPQPIIRGGETHGPYRVVIGSSYCTISGLIRGLLLKLGVITTLNNNPSYRLYIKLNNFILHEVKCCEQ